MCGPSPLSLVAGLASHETWTPTRRLACGSGQLTARTNTRSKVAHWRQMIDCRRSAQTGNAQLVVSARLVIRVCLGFNWPHEMHFSRRSCRLEERMPKREATSSFKGRQPQQLHSLQRRRPKTLPSQLRLRGAKLTFKWDNLIGLTAEVARFGPVGVGGFLVLANSHRRRQACDVVGLEVGVCVAIQLLGRWVSRCVSSAWLRRKMPARHLLCPRSPSHLLFLPTGRLSPRPFIFARRLLSHCLSHFHAQLLEFLHLIGA